MMEYRALVSLDPGDSDISWLFVIVESSTGIAYSHQYGGTAVRYSSIEGYLVPVFCPPALVKLRQIFEEELHGSGTEGWPMTQAQLDRLREVVSEISFWESTKDEHVSELILNETRIREIDEAFVPILSPDGPGVLVWNNSD